MIIECPDLETAQEFYEEATLLGAICTIVSADTKVSTG
jgi:hypothetical protein